MNNINTSRMNITTKIWLSIGVYVLGFIVSVVLGQLQGVGMESSLRTTSDALFPVAQQSQLAEAGFQRMVKAFSDAVLIQDSTGLDRAVTEGQGVVEGLTAVAAIPGLSAQRATEVRKLASSVQQFVGDARSTYGTLLANPTSMTPEMQNHMRELAARTDSIKTSLQSAKEQASKDLRDELNTVRAGSAQQRWVALAVFFVTLCVASVIVNLTIRRSISGPILRVIHGVQGAADGAAQASNQMARSGEVVARDAQSQAAALEETSASLVEISATTQENASRATQADGLMGNARDAIQRASQAMDDLTRSMDEISKSSRQVAEVLKSIDEIAFHTNILALNAAVEAARAGEIGAGFSVVAGEVRSLAKRSAEAARLSAEIVEKTITDVKGGVALVSLAHGSFNEVSAMIASGSQMVSQIASSSKEQARGVTQIGEAVSRMETVTQNNVANAQQTAASASDMIHQMKTTRKHLQELVAVVGLQKE